MLVDFLIKNRKICSKVGGQMKKNFIKDLTFKEKIEILEDYKRLEEKGSIEECLLRDKANEFSNAETPILRMQILASNIAFDIAYHYINELKKMQ